jgi:Domain of unknown function (DUF4169)
MAEIVNLTRRKKQAQRDEATQLAKENRARFGRTKAERARDEAARGAQQKLLDQARKES